MLLYGGLALVAYLVLKPKTAAAPIVLPNTPVNASAMQLAAPTQASGGILNNLASLVTSTVRSLTASNAPLTAVSEGTGPDVLQSTLPANAGRSPVVSDLSYAYTKPDFNSFNSIELNPA